MEQLIAAMGVKYNGDPRIAFITKAKIKSTKVKLFFFFTLNPRQNKIFFLVCE